jgi:group I intron endonuclease
MISNSGVYKIHSLVYPDRCYVGSTIDLVRRWKQHLTYLRIGKHYNRKLQNHFNKYGESDLRFEIIKYCNSEDLLRYEQSLLSEINTFFNIAKNAGSSLGIKRSEKTKHKIGIANKGKIVSSVTRQRLRNANLGKKYSEVTQLKHRASVKPLSTEARNKIIQANLGKHHTDQTKQKIGFANSGKKRSLESRKKMSDKKLGSHHSIETKRKISNTLKSRITIEERLIRSESMLGEKHFFFRETS